MFRLTILSLALLTLVSVSLAIDSSLDGVWNDFKIHYIKKYITVAEEIHRRTAFEQHVAIIHKHNLEEDLGFHSYRMGLNQFADLTNEEYRNTVLGSLRSNSTNQMRDDIYPVIYDVAKLPTSVDWRKKGYVTPIFDQGQCAGSWAISPIGALEGQHKAVTGDLVSLSVQNLIDCVPDSMGCAGGTIGSAYKYMIKHGVDTAACYNFTGQQSTCKFNKTCIGATMKTMMTIDSGSESKLQFATAKIGPISVFIDASHVSFQLYTSGVYDEPACTSTFLCHAMLVVGYGTQDNADYWLVKNSWSTAWGEKGYILMSRNKNNQCGIATAATYPAGVGF